MTEIKPKYIVSTEKELGGLKKGLENFSLPESIGGLLV